MIIYIFLFQFTLHISPGFIEELSKYCSNEESFFEANQNLIETLKGGNFYDLNTMYSNTGREIRGPFIYNQKEAVIKRVDETGFGEEWLIQEVRLMRKLNKDEQFMVMYDCYYEFSPDNKILVNMILEKLGKDLTYMRNKLLSKTPKQKAELYINLAQDYIDLHNKYQIVHSDLKPDNVVSIDDNISRMKIIDFGISCEIGSTNFGGNQISLNYEKFLIENVKMKKEFDTFSFAMLLCSFEQSDKDYRIVEIISGDDILIFKANLITQCNKDHTFNMKFKNNFKIKKFNQNIEKFSDIFKMISNPDIGYRRTLEDFVEVMKAVEFEDNENEDIQAQKVDLNSQSFKIRL